MAKWSRRMRGMVTVWHVWQHRTADPRQTCPPPISDPHAWSCYSVPGAQLALLIIIGAATHVRRSRRRTPQTSGLGSSSLVGALDATQLRPALQAAAGCTISRTGWFGIASTYSSSLTPAPCAPFMPHLGCTSASLAPRAPRRPPLIPPVPATPHQCQPQPLSRRRQRSRCPPPATGSICPLTHRPPTLWHGRNADNQTAPGEPALPP